MGLNLPKGPGLVDNGAVHLIGEANVIQNETAGLVDMHRVQITLKTVSHMLCTKTKHPEKE